MAPKQDPNFFELPSVFTMVLIASGMTLTAMCVYCPDKIPYHCLGIIGDLAHYLAYERPKVIAAIWYVAVAIHVTEAIYAFYLAGQKGITGVARLKWFISTLCFGIGSLSILLDYDPTRSSSVDDIGDESDNDHRNDVVKTDKPYILDVIEVDGDNVRKIPL